MPKNLLVLAVEKPFWQDVLIDLESRGVNIAAAVVHYRYKHSPKKYFENYKGVQIDGKKFYRVKDVRKLTAEMFGNNVEVLDEEIINHLMPAERDFYILTDRFCYLPVSFRYRKRLFRDLIRFWLSFFRDNKIDMLYCSCTPHNFSDYTAYHAAKYLGIPTMQLAHTMINDHVIIRADYREEEKAPADYLAGKSEPDVIAEIPESIYQSAFAESNVLQAVISKNDAAQGIKNKNVSSLDNKSGIDFGKIAKRFKRNFFRAPSFKGALAMNGTFPPSVRRILKMYDKPWQLNQKKFHDKMAVSPDLNTKYIYFAMHLQPERTSTPEAGLFEDHLLAIALLAKSLPEGWKVYVKENPRQFNRLNTLKGRHHRDKTDYEDILALPNVSLIRQDIATKDLIQNAQIVSTLSGSVGWEALRAGKPCIVFAPAWYSACQSTYLVKTIEQCRESVKAAAKSTPEKVKMDILKYLAFMKGKMVLGNMGNDSYINSSKIEYGTIVKNVSDVLSERIASKQSS